MTTSLGLRLEGSEALIRALDDHMKTCEFADQLERERDGLLGSMATLRLMYAEVIHAQAEQMRLDLFIAGWQENRASVWRSPARKVVRGTAPAWHAMRGMELAA